MLRFLGVVLVLILGVAGVGYYLGWFSVSTSGDGRNTTITVDKQKMEADEEIAKKKLQEAEKKIKDNVKSATDRSKQ